MHYDPMIAKLVVWGENRTAALVKLKDSLSKFQVLFKQFNSSYCILPVGVLHVDVYRVTLVGKNFW